MTSNPEHPSIAILGAGYVGSELARLSIARGWRVAALTRNPAAAAALRTLGCQTVVSADLASDDWHRMIGRPFTRVLVCVSPGGGGLAGYRHSSVSGMESVARWLRTQPPGTVVYTSSTGVYPQGDGAIVDESATTEAGEGRGGLLRLAEQRLEEGAAAAGWRWFVLRLAGIYGPGRHRILDQIRAGEPLTGDPAVHLNLIHRDDICSAILACLDAEDGKASATFNLSDNNPPTRSGFASWIASSCGLPPPRFDTAAHSEGSPFGRRATPDRVIVATRIRSVLGWAPRHPDFRSGYGALIEGD